LLVTVAYLSLKIAPLVVKLVHSLPDPVEFNVQLVVVDDSRGFVRRRVDFQGPSERSDRDELFRHLLSTLQRAALREPLPAAAVL
jgi:hypothetical protein